MPIKLTGNVQLGNMGGGPSSLRLSDLADVSIVAPQTGQYLRYNATIQEWQNSFLNADISAYLSTAFIAGQNITITPGVNTYTFSVPLSLSGDATGVASSGNIPVTLATVNATPGTYGSASQVPIITVDDKGRITSISNISISGGGSAANILGGSTGAIPYQSATSTTSFLGAGSTSQVLIGGASSPSWSNAPTLTGTNFTGIPNSGLVNNSITIGSSTIALGGTLTSLSGLSSVSATTFVGTFTGSAASLTTARNITATGDATWSVLFDGSADVTDTLTLATVNASPQTNAFRKVTVNGKGLVTATSSVTPTDITTALGFTPVDVAGDTMTGYLILNADPVAALGAATKQYVDLVAMGLNVHASCVTSTTAALPASTYNNGASGVGATLTANANGALGTVGGYASLSLNDRVLVKDQSNQVENGIYVVTDLGSVSTPWILTRSADMDGSPASELRSGDYTFIVNGTLANTQWAVTTPNPITVGTSLIAFTQISGSASYTAGSGIDITGLVVSNTGVLSNVAGSGISVSSATGNVTITNTGVTSLTAGSNIGLSGSTGNITVSVTGSVPTATTATNIAGGATGSLPYQSASNTTTFLAAGTTSQVLVGGASSPSWSNTPTLTGTNFTGIPNAALNNSSVTIGTTNIALGGTSTTLAGLTSVTSTTFVGSLTGNASTATTATSATNATNTAITDDTTTNATKYLAWVDATSGNNPLKVSSTKLTFNPSTGILTATGFSGAISGNATTATALQTARTIAISGGATGTATSFDGTANISIPVTNLDASTLGTGTVPVARLTGTYNISISGNAATATTATNNVLKAGDTMTGALQINSTLGVTGISTLSGGVYSGGGVSPGNYVFRALSTTGDRLRIASQPAGSGVAIDVTDAAETTTARPLALGASNGSISLGGTVSAANTVTINSGGVLPLLLTTNSNGPYSISLNRSDLALQSRVYNDNGSRWWFEHRPSFAGNTPLDSANYNSFAPTLTGTGASGTWSINITGNAATATSATSATTATTANSLNTGNNYQMNALGVGTSNTTAGTIYATGDITAFSDVRVKDNIEVIVNALDKVSMIRGVTFTRKDSANQNRHAGVIAQEVEKVLPEVVTESDSGMKGVAYGNMVGLLVEAIKELRQEVSNLKSELSNLKAK